MLSVAAAAGLLFAAGGASFTSHAARTDDGARVENTPAVGGTPGIGTSIAREVAIAAPEPAAPFTLGPSPVEVAMVAAPEGAISGSRPPLAVWQPASQENTAPPPPAQPVAQWSAVVSEEPPPRDVGEAARPRLVQRPSTPAAPKVVSSAFTSRVLGKWVPDREACVDPDASDYLPLRISAVDATAGEAACRFVSQSRRGQAWNVVAECSDGSSEWNANVNLAVVGGQLTWSSERGVQTYVRCEETRIAKRATREQVAHRATKTRSKVAARKPPAVRVIGGGSTPKTWALLRVR